MWEDKICGRCKKVFTPSSRHKCCPKCRTPTKKIPCGVCQKVLTMYGRCSRCASSARVGTGRWVTAKGYVEMSTPDGRILEHRFVIEGLLGRRLLKGENVHHKNGVKNDNRPDNLELWVSFQPNGQRPEDLLEWADEIIKRYRS